MHFAYAILRLQLTRVCLGSSASAYTFARRASMVLGVLRHHGHILRLFSGAWALWVCRHTLETRGPQAGLGLI